MSVFKAYDIRGIAGTELDSEFAERLGRALATHLEAKCVSGPEQILDGKWFIETEFFCSEGFAFRRHASCAFSRYTCSFLSHVIETLW